MNRFPLVLSLGIGALILATQHAFAQAGNCATRDDLAARLERTYGETRQSMGLASDNTLIEVYASQETGTWTLTITRPGGPTCIVAAGEAYQTLRDPRPAPGKPA